MAGISLITTTTSAYVFNPNQPYTVFLPGINQCLILVAYIFVAATETVLGAFGVYCVVYVLASRQGTTSGIVQEEQS